MKTLETTIVAVSEVSGSLTKALFELYAQYYEATSWKMFSRDLSAKDYILIVRDDTGRVRGFTTIAVIDLAHAGSPVRALFSGDTIMRREDWGRQDLAFNWIRFAGSVKKRRPELPLYWFLIVKGHRTYRYLSAFSLRFFPHWTETTPIWEQGLMDCLAHSLFGEFYDPRSGVLHFPDSRGHLRAAFATVTETEARRQDVAFFLRKNPGYKTGDELVCLTELRPDNLKPIARRLFLQGWPA